MVELVGGGGLGAGGMSDDDDDDIAKFERQCAERARAEGLAGPAEDEDQAASEDDDPDDRARRVRLAAGMGPSPKSGDDWREKCLQMQERLSRKDAELSQARGDLDMVRNEGTGPNDPSTELKQRLLDLTKKNRRLQVSLESQKSKIQHLEAELKRPREEVRRQAEEMAAKSTEAAIGEGSEEWKKKYLTASNKLQEVRHEVSDLRAQLQRQKKVLLKELGSEEALEKAMAVVDDPMAVQFKGRAAQISQLQRQVRELREQLKRPGGAEDAEPPAEFSAPEPAQRQGRGRPEQVGERESRGIGQAADKRREEFEKLQEEAERLRGEAADVKRKRDAMKSRNGVLEGQLRDMKASVQDLLKKSENDDALVDALRRQLGRHGPGGAEVPQFDASLEEMEALREENAELQGQLERQAQIVVQLRQKNLANACENGSTKLGPRSVEAGTGERQLVDRVRYLEAENAKQLEQVKLLHARLGEAGGEPVGRPFSAESSVNLKDKLRHTCDRLAAAERENLAQRQRTVDLRREPDSSPSCGSRGSMSRSSSRGAGVAFAIG